MQDNIVHRIRECLHSQAKLLLLVQQEIQLLDKEILVSLEPENVIMRGNFFDLWNTIYKKLGQNQMEGKLREQTNERRRNKRKRNMQQKHTYIYSKIDFEHILLQIWYSCDSHFSHYPPPWVAKWVKLLGKLNIVLIRLQHFHPSTFQFLEPKVCFINYMFKNHKQNWSCALIFLTMGFSCCLIW